jgi:signal transduction histidine kinase
VIRRRWPLALAILFVALLTWYLLYTERVAGALQDDAATLTQIFAEVQALVQDPSPESTDRRLFELQDLILDVGVPLVLTGPGDSVFSAANLPFVADPDTPEGQIRIRAYVRTLDARNPPVGDPEVTRIHYGDPPELRQLRWIPWLQAGGLLLTVLTGVTLIRYQWRAESERAWTLMARELAHQLGTPISSLQGWLEVLGLPHGDRPGEVTDEQIAREVGEDLVRLERIARRFELIGRTPELGGLDVHRLARNLERYLRARLPRLGPGVELHLDLPESLPAVRGNEVLLAWALENVVKNSLDALAGRGGRISIRGEHAEAGWVVLEIADDGPGVAPEIRDRLFEPGTTTKPKGWGVGLALSRRIVEGAHGGKIELVEARHGARIRVKLPAVKG